MNQMTSKEVINENDPSYSLRQEPDALEGLEERHLLTKMRISQGDPCVVLNNPI
jgi:hypothetical protein